MSFGLLRGTDFASAARARSEAHVHSLLSRDDSKQFNLHHCILGALSNIVSLNLNRWAFPKIRGRFVAVPRVRIVVHWGPYLGTHLWRPP